jgi:hypothetical protein
MYKTIEKENRTYFIDDDGTITVKELPQVKIKGNFDYKKEFPKFMLDQLKKQKIDLSERVYYSGMCIYLEVAKASIEAMQKQNKEAKEKLNKNVPGLEELEKIKEEWDTYYYKFEKMMNDEFNDGVNPPKKPSKTIEEVTSLYPIASAYLKAESFILSNHHAKYSAGKKAKERIINGEDFKVVIEDMEKEWSDYAKEHIWD